MLDITVMVFSLFVSLYLRVGPTEFVDHLQALLIFLPVVIVVRVAALTSFGCYSVMWRYVSTIDAVRLAKAVLMSTAITILVTFFLPEQVARLPRSVYIIDAILVTLVLMGLRLARRVHYESQSNRTAAPSQRTLIYGAGNNGRTLANRFRSDSGLDTEVVGFVDDDPEKQGLDINGIPVVGTREDLTEVLRKFEVTQMIIALPELPGEILREVAHVARKFNIRPRITTQLNQVSGSLKNVEIYRDLNLSDLLNRPPKVIDLQSLREMIRGKVVLITGAGGSIGSEIARQVMALGPVRLLLLDHAEYNLYEIDKELRLATHDLQTVIPLLVDIKDNNSLQRVFHEFRPDIVFHAAAYKHVHLVEANPYPAILNNVFGTRNVLRQCETSSVQTFVMISTDKAVNPAGVMGSTKRVCELLVTAAAIRTGRRYCSVRFGNVLGSSGSLIPLLQKQIQDGSPVTVTHKDMTRFFMLIPEAVMLVLKAATIARPGDINVLRMGEPVKITDVARSMIALMGKTENEVPIIFTGLRPGEKMFEELYIRGDELTTEHPDILTLPHGDSQLHLDASELQLLEQQVERMLIHAQSSSKEAVMGLNQLVRSNYVHPVDEDLDTTHQVPQAARPRRPI
jgi:FlaA1/EpsC-like NDP-sugar epimerase